MNRNIKNKDTKQIVEQSKIKSYKNDVKKTLYMDYVFETSPKSSHFKNLFWAYMIGGLICAFGQVIIEIFIQNFKRADICRLFNFIILYIIFQSQHSYAKP